LVKTYLFSVDLEDIRTLIANGERYAERLPVSAARYLAFLSKHEMRCTFFTVGNVARRYPDLIRELVSQGHEVACRSSEHVPLDRHTAASFREDLERSLSGLPGLDVPYAAGVYFRVLPFALIRYLFQRQLKRGKPVIGYLRPYDMDEDQERFMHPELKNSRLYNALMYVYRRRVFPRLEKLVAFGATIVPYADYVTGHLEANAASCA
jgi:hypothetical protein